MLPSPPPEPKLVEKPGNRSRRAILDAAARLLRSSGYRAATVREIAAAVGIKAASIYSHFSSKEEIVAAVMNDGVDHVFKAVTAGLEGLPQSAAPRTKLEAAIRAHLHALLEYSDYTSAALKAYNDAPEVVRRAARPHRARYEALWEKLISELAEAGLVPSGVSPETMRFAVLGLMNWSPEWYRPQQHSVDVLAGEFASLLVRPLPVSPTGNAGSC